MYIRGRFLVVALLIPGSCASFAVGQSEAAAPPHRVAHVADGGTNEVLESIAIPATAHAPFFATLDTEWARPLTGGGSYIFQNERHVARDSSGRIYQERWYLVPKNGKVKSEMNYIQVDDPVSHLAYTCNVSEKVCSMRSFDPPPEVTFRGYTGEQGVIPNGWGFVTEEELGKQTLAGIETIGVRQTNTINPWVMGNDRPMSVVREYWHSASLNINLLSTLTDPRFGTQTFTIREISTSEPDPQLFLPPAGYKMVDQRGYAPPVH